ncbi:hypothetical protein CI238_09484, partial [Colletotrichum incanum]
LNEHANEIIIDSWGPVGAFVGLMIGANGEGVTGKSAQCDNQCAGYKIGPLPLTATRGIEHLGLSCWQHHSQNNGAGVLGLYHTCSAQAGRVYPDANQKLISWFGELLLDRAHLRPFLSSALETCLNQRWHAVRKGLHSSSASRRFLQNSQTPSMSISVLVLEMLGKNQSDIRGARLDDFIIYHNWQCRANLTNQ